MRTLEILKYPDAALKQVCSETGYTMFGTPKLRDIVSKMVFTMRKAGGIGLACNQVGIISQQIIVVDTKNVQGKRVVDPWFGVLINPTITSSSSETEMDNEGCLSFPGQYAKVCRNFAVEVKYYNIDGFEQRRTFKGLTARCVQHEIDHLQGITMRDKEE